MMPVATVLSCVLILFGAHWGQSAEPVQGPEGSDPYSLELVRFSLRMRSGGKKYIQSTIQKQLTRLGDKVSVALLKILDEHQLADSQIVRDLLPIVRDAFSVPELISSEEDKQPQVTRFLLKHLEREFFDPQIKRDIRETLQFIEEKSKFGSSPKTGRSSDLSQ